MKFSSTFNLRLVPELISKLNSNNMSGVSLKPSKLMQQQGKRLTALLFCFFTFPAMAKTIIVHPGESIQAAIDSARTGTTIKVLPGIYQEGTPGSLNAITITKAGIRLVGLAKKKSPVVLLSNGQQYGIWVSPADTIGPGQSDEEHPPCASSGAKD